MRSCRRVLLLSLLALVACRRSEPPAANTAARVIVISIDTLRSDHLPAYGYPGVRTPAIDALRADGILVRHAFSATPLTLPSHATILTGLLPANHGMLDNVGYTLAPSVETMASRMKAAGFATGAAVSSYVLRRETGIGRGFDFYDDAMTRSARGAETSATRDGADTERALEQWIASNGTDRFLAFLHLYEPHTPYEPTYDDDIARADAIVGRFIGFLRERRLYDDALIVLLSDHGEGLGDHGEAEHGIFLYREAIQVPLIVKLPRSERRGESVASLVSLTDIWPTIAPRLGLQVGGVDALGAPEPQRQLYAESFFAKIHFGWHEQRAMLDARHHYVDSVRSELFDWVADPAEKKNILGEERRAAASLRGALPPAVFRAPSAISEEDRRALESLGYLASSSGSSGAAPDPKDKIGTLHFYTDGLAALKKGDGRSATTSLRAFVRENPDMSDGWVALAEAQERSGDPSGAMDSLRVAMSKFPGNPVVVLSMASALFQRSQYEEAEKHARLVLDSDPVPAHDLLAAMAEKRGDVPAAEEHLAALLQRTPTNARAQFRHGEVLLRLGRVAEAEAAYRAATSGAPGELRAWASLALVQHAQGKRDEALATLAEAIRLNPGPRSRAMAVEVLQTAGDREGIRRLDALAR